VTPFKLSLNITTYTSSTEVIKPMTILNKALMQLRNEISPLLPTGVNPIPPEEHSGVHRVAVIEALIAEFFDKTPVTLMRKRKTLVNLGESYLCFLRLREHSIHEPKDLLPLLDVPVFDQNTYRLAQSLNRFALTMRDNAARIVDQFAMTMLISKKNRERLIEGIEAVFSELPERLNAKLDHYDKVMKKAA
jgi:hypothetical protein